ncbi:uncharacterized protein VTP21DRAFT_3206 [Calcarisporiella thermophila]|uniref:uncharacterized protein n=1 Tax=Calcarisporiella thermophila TaxID=911321 RepID=UPI003743B868
MNAEQLNHYIWPNPAAFLVSQAAITPVSSPVAQLQKVDALNGFNEGIWNDEDHDATMKLNDECTQDPLQEVIYSSGTPSNSGATDPEVADITEGSEVMQARSFESMSDWWTGEEDSWNEKALKKVTRLCPALKHGAHTQRLCHHAWSSSNIDPVWLASEGKENGLLPVCVQSERWEPRGDGILFDQVTRKIIQIRPSRAQEFPGGPCKRGGGMTALHYFTSIQPGDATVLMMSKAAGRWFITAHGNLLWQQAVSMVALGIGVPVYSQYPGEYSWCAYIERSSHEQQLEDTRPNVNYRTSNLQARITLNAARLSRTGSPLIRWQYAACRAHVTIGGHPVQTAIRSCAGRFMQLLSDGAAEAGRPPVWVVDTAAQYAWIGYPHACLSVGGLHHVYNSKLRRSAIACVECMAQTAHIILGWNDTMKITTDLGQDKLKYVKSAHLLELQNILARKIVAPTKQESACSTAAN